MPETRNADARRLDVSGAIAEFTGSGGITWALIEVSGSGWGASAVWSSAVLGMGMAPTARIQPGDEYLTAVLPAVIVLGLGLSVTVPPVTSAALSAATARWPGIASGIHNAVARAARVLTLGVVRWIAGLAGEEIHRQDALASGSLARCWRWRASRSSAACRRGSH